MILDAESWLRDKDFSFTIGECNVNSFVKYIKKLFVGKGCAGTDSCEEFISFFEVSIKEKVIDKIENICTYSYAHTSIAFDEVTRRGHQFTAEYLNDGTSWNYEH